MYPNPGRQGGPPPPFSRVNQSEREPTQSDQYEQPQYNSLMQIQSMVSPMIQQQQPQSHIPLTGQTPFIECVREQFQDRVMTAAALEQLILQRVRTNPIDAHGYYQLRHTYHQAMQQQAESQNLQTERLTPPGQHPYVTLDQNQQPLQQPQPNSEFWQQEIFRNWAMYAPSLDQYIAQQPQHYAPLFKTYVDRLDRAQAYKTLVDAHLQAFKVLDYELEQGNARSVSTHTTAAQVNHARVNIPARGRGRPRGVRSRKNLLTSLLPSQTNYPEMGPAINRSEISNETTTLAPPVLETDRHFLNTDITLQDSTTKNSVSTHTTAAHVNSAGMNNLGRGRGRGQGRGRGRGQGRGRGRGQGRGRGRGLSKRSARGNLSTRKFKNLLPSQTYHPEVGPARNHWETSNETTPFAPHVPETGRDFKDTDITPKVSTTKNHAALNNPEALAQSNQSMRSYLSTQGATNLLPIQTYHPEVGPARNHWETSNETTPFAPPMPETGRDFLVTDITPKVSTTKNPAALNNPELAQGNQSMRSYLSTQGATNLLPIQTYHPEVGPARNHWETSNETTPFAPPMPETGRDFLVTDITPKVSTTKNPAALNNPELAQGNQSTRSDLSTQGATNLHLSQPYPPEVGPVRNHWEISDKTTQLATPPSHAPVIWWKHRKFPQPPRNL